MDWPRPPEKGDRAWERSRRGANRGRAARPHDRGARRRNQVLESAKVELRTDFSPNATATRQVCRRGQVRDAIRRSIPPFAEQFGPRHGEAVQIPSFFGFRISFPEKDFGREMARFSVGCVPVF